MCCTIAFREKKVKFYANGKKKGLQRRHIGGSCKPLYLGCLRAWLVCATLAIQASILVAVVVILHGITF
jgi:hypothetical protein